MKRVNKKDLRAFDLRGYLDKNGWLQNVTEHLMSRYGVSLDIILNEYKVYSFNLFGSSVTYQGVADLRSKTIELGSYDMITTEDIDLGTIVHELSHVCQKLGGTWNQLNPPVWKKFVVRWFGTASVKKTFYWNNPVERDARASVDEFASTYGYKDLVAGN